MSLLISLFRAPFNGCDFFFRFLLLLLAWDFSVLPPPCGAAQKRKVMIWGRVEQIGMLILPPLPSPPPPPPPPPPPLCPKSTSSQTFPFPSLRLSCFPPPSYKLKLLDFLFDGRARKTERERERERYLFNTRVRTLFHCTSFCVDMSTQRPEPRNRVIQLYSRCVLTRSLSA
jgi:hypothetical protein